MFTQSRSVGSAVLSLLTPLLLPVGKLLTYKRAELSSAPSLPEARHSKQQGLNLQRKTGGIAQWYSMCKNPGSISSTKSDKPRVSWSGEAR
jgi:hypothetical protein